ncbi:hypothetical protein SPRG_16082 [Saprolegnia parasitica CBS 223.65]|uniref:Uncharacterized protein n=1 Tax=Saprolegnia parasitica (strain CBS 223.65) TaxID=695850 RepID=A0A067BV68_SAPPC|nr:hypothetical protein SPRG_16082 [Saprolegnia parasitica CBS 223.65]KDO18527.1 hypothetical protein SPRG_16082 [Saprolegnia parasitica CBS 223.65]|eukprot:XP_012210762.1 hypothetical protein SPRG_16082 [Saprolegnia parasitica CBS 223.65]
METKVSHGLWPAPSALPQALRSMLADSLRPSPSTTYRPRPSSSSSTSRRRPCDRARFAVAVRAADRHGAWLDVPARRGLRGRRQLLFEREVKLKLPARLMDVLGVVRRLRDTAIIDFPPEVFLQRPATLQYLLHPSRRRFSSLPRALATHVLCDLTAGWLQPCRLLAHATSPHHTSRYPSSAGAPVDGSWSLAGGFHQVVALVTAPQVHLVAAVAPTWRCDADGRGQDASRFTRLFIANVLLAPHVDKHAVMALLILVTDVSPQLTRSEMRTGTVEAL